jgi:hypothetical protein
MRSHTCACLLLALALAACSSNPGGPSSSGPATARGSHSAITAEQLLELQVSNAYDALQQLRPEWLRGGTAFGGRPGVVVVYLDGNRYGEPLSLRQIPLEHIASMRYLSSRELRTELPLSQLEGVSGAIMVSTSRLGEARIETRGWTGWGTEARRWSFRLLPSDTRASTAAQMQAAVDEDGWTDPLFTGEQLPHAVTEGYGVALAVHYRYSRRVGFEVIRTTAYRSKANGYKHFTGVLHGEVATANTSALVTTGETLRLGVGPSLASTAGVWRRRNQGDPVEWVDRRLGVVADLSFSYPRESLLFLEMRAHARAFPPLDLPEGHHFPGARTSDRSLFLGVGGGIRF